MPWIYYKCKTCGHEDSHYVFTRKERNPFYPGIMELIEISDSLKPCEMCAKEQLDKYRYPQYESGEESGNT